MNLNVQLVSLLVQLDQAACTVRVNGGKTKLMIRFDTVIVLDKVGYVYVSLSGELFDRYSRRSVPTIPVQARSV